MNFTKLTKFQYHKLPSIFFVMQTLIDSTAAAPTHLLNNPITAKSTCYVRNSLYRVGSSSMQGWRPTMEDCHIHILSLPDDPGTAFFGVYDGHGGSEISDYVGKHLHKFILKRPEYKRGDIAKAIEWGFLDIDEEMFEQEYFRSSYAGSTAIMALLKDGKLYCGNVGDSRAIASVNGKVVELSRDHKPDDVEELTRINSAGGWVSNGRVNGSLALSRALGDFSFKRDPELDADKQIVSCCPEVVTKEITKDWDFVILACDGIWEVLTNEAVACQAIRHIAEGIEPDEICEKLMERCMASKSDNPGGIGCDNMTVVMACLLHGKPYENLQDKCKKYSKKLDCACTNKSGL